MMKIAFTVKTPRGDSELERKAISVLKECLSHVNDASVSFVLQPQITGSIEPDILVNFTYDGRKRKLFVEVKKTGEPLYAHVAFNQLERYRKGEPEAVGVFIAPYISPQTAELCRVQNVCYLDLAGNCHFAFDGIYIHIEGKPNPAARSRPLRSLYQPKAERVLRVLLTNPKKLWRFKPLANEAEVSVGQVFKVKELLREREWLEETEQGLFLKKPRELLSAWAENYRYGKHKAAQFYTLSDLAQFEQTLSFGCRQRNIPCAFTSFTAAARYAPYADSRRTTAYIHREQPEVQDLLSLPTLQLEAVETGANVILVTPYDEGVFYDARHRQDISIVSPLQTYLDLQSTGTRGREAAEFLLQKEIVPNW